MVKFTVINSENNLIIGVICIISMLLFSFVIHSAFADSINIVRHKVTETSNTCGGIGVTPSTKYVFMDCDTGGATATIRVYLYNGTTQQATTTYAQTAGDAQRSIAYPIDTTTVVFYTGCASASCSIFREFQIGSGPSVSNTRTFTVATCTPQTAMPIRIGTNIFFACTNGDVREFNPLTFTQVNSYSGLTTGTPTCATTPRGIAMITSTKGVTLCNDAGTSKFISFTLSGSSVTKVASVNTLDAMQATTNLCQYTSFNSTVGFVYCTSTQSGANDVVSVNLSSLALGTPINFASNADIYTDIGVLINGWYLFPDATSDNVLVLNGNSAPPNNFMFTGGLGGNDLASNARMQLDSSSMLGVMSKGVGVNNTLWYWTLDHFGITGLNTPPPGTGSSSPAIGIDCTDPNFSYRLMCAGTTPLVGTSAMLNQSTTNIVCQVGLQKCTQDANGNFVPSNPDIKTNGIGYMILVVALLVYVGIMWVASRGDLGGIPTFVWAIGAFGIILILTMFQWIDATALVIGTLAIIGLAVVRLRSTIGGSQIFESSGAE